MATKTKHKLVIGKWSTPESGGAVFTAEPMQPTTEITQMKDMISWATESLDFDFIGEFSFIKVVPGELLVGTQMSFDFMEG